MKNTFPGLKLERVLETPAEIEETTPCTDMGSKKRIDL